MTQPNIKSDLANTYHRDGTVSYWSVQDQQWRRLPAGEIPDEDLASMSDRERARIARIADR